MTTDKLRDALEAALAAANELRLSSSEFPREQIIEALTPSPQDHRVDAKPDEVERLKEAMRLVEYDMAHRPAGPHKSEFVAVKTEVATIITALRAALRTPVLSDDPAKVREEQREVERLRNVLSGLSSSLGAGMGDESTTAEDFEKRVEWGVSHLLAATIRRCADIVEQRSKAPAGITWGKLRTEILALADDAALRRDADGGRG